MSTRDFVFVSSGRKLSAIAAFGIVRDDTML